MQALCKKQFFYSLLVWVAISSQATYLFAQLRPSHQQAVGTMNNQPLLLYTNSYERMRISSTGKVGVGNLSPLAEFEVTGNADFSGAVAAGDNVVPGNYFVEGAGFFPALAGQRTLSSATSSTYRSIGVLGHVNITGKVDNRVMSGAFYVTSDASNIENIAQVRALQGWSAHSGTGTLSNAWGAYLVVTNKSTGTIANAYGAVAGVENASASTINKLHALSIEAWNNKGGRVDTLFGAAICIYNNNSASTIGAAYGLSIGRGMITTTGGTHFWRNSGVINNSYGIYLDPSIDVGLNRYAIFSLSTSTSRLTGNLELSNSDNSARELRFLEPSQDGTNFTAFKSQPQSSNIIYTLPATAPQEGQVLAVNSSNNNLVWTSPAFLPLRLTTQQRDALVSPVAGIIIFNTDLNKHQAWDGTVWNMFY